MPDTATLLQDHFQSRAFEELLNFNENSTNEDLVRTIIRGAEGMMKKYGKDITYTQLRNILQIVKNEKYKEDHTDLLLAIPKLAYLEGRPQKGENGAAIIGFIREMAWEVKSVKKYEAFEEIMNTLVAYHKIHG